MSTANPITLNLSPDAAARLLAILEGELESLEGKTAGVRRDIDSVKKLLAANPSSAAPALIVKKNPGGRARKGEADRVVLAFLQKYKGIGMNQADIHDKTGLSMSTVFRSLKRLSKAGKIQGSAGSWDAVS